MAAKLEVHQYLVTTITGDWSRSTHSVQAAYVKNENGFIEFKNAHHEMVLMVAASSVVSITRDVPAAGSIVPADYKADAQGNTERLKVDEQQMGGK